MGELRRFFWRVLNAVRPNRDTPAFRWLDDVRRDTGYAVRMLRRHPLATVTTALSLAIGIGLNTAVFTVVDWVLLRPLPYPAPHELVRVFTAGISPAGGPRPLIYEEFKVLGEAAAFRASVAFTVTTRVMSAAGAEPIHVSVARVSGDLFGTFGVTPEVGRAFTAAEMSGGAPVVVLRHNVWQSQLSADANILGRTVLIDGTPHTVIGVMPTGRGYPSDADLWRPMMASEHEDDDRELGMVGRLRTDVTSQSASTELATLAHAVSNRTRTAWAEQVQRTEVNDVRTALQALFGAAMLTLLIACANLAALVAARGADRAGEIAVRGALGATRARVLSQLIVESLVLCLIGGSLGLLFGRWALAGLIGLAPVSLPRLADISLDSRILLIGMAATVLTALIVGMGPAWRLSRLTEPSALTRMGWLRATPRSSGRRAMVLAQVATAVILTTGAMLLTRSLQHLVSLDHGFDADRLVAVDLSLRGSFNGDTRQLFRDLVATTERLPGVQSATVAMRLPTQLIGLRAPTSVVGEGELSVPATLRPVSPSYFDTVGIAVTTGRAFRATDGERSPRVAIVNRAFVQVLLDGRPAVGLRITTPFAEGPLAIVGVVSDVTPAGEADRPALYVPTDQLSIGGGYLIARTSRDPGAIIPSLTRRIRDTVPALAADRVHRVAESLEESRAVTRFSTQVAGIFAALALVLSMIGIYGLTAGDVAARWRELAVRLTLGASRTQVLWTVLRPCAALLGAGAVLGVIGALSVRPALGALLHEMTPADLGALVAAPGLLAVVGIVAALLAAKRVLHSDPAATLRND